MDTEKEFTCVSPEYVKNFRCDGLACSAKCCKGYQVDVDRYTHEKYKHIASQKLRAKILDSLYWNKSSKTYRMKLNENAICPMLQGDFLCSIQKYLGEDYLSDTCADFPRRTYVVDEIVERSLSLTCPVAAKLALLNPTPMRLEPITFKTTHSASFFYRSVNEMPSRKHLLLLQQIAFTILQDKRLTLNKRLAALGIILSEIDAILANGKAEHLNLMINIYNYSDEYFIDLQKKIDSMHFNCENYLSIMFGLTDRIFSKAVLYYSKDQRDFAQYVPLAFNFQDKINKPIPELIQLYEKNIHIYKEIVHKPFNHLLENYLSHNFFAGLYPCHFSNTLINNYFLFLTLYKFFEFGLISMAAVMGDKISVDDILEFVERFSHRIDHATLFRQITLDYIYKFEQWPMEFMSSLIDISIK